MSDPVLALIQSKGHEYRISGKDYLIKCLNPDHNDTNPSMRIDKVTGVLHCFSCGFKHNLFKYYGIFTNNTSIRVAKLKEKLEELRNSSMDVELPDGHTPYTQKFRGISTNTLKHFGAFYTNSAKVEKLQDRIIFPIKDVSSRIISMVGRHVLSNGNPRYIIYPSGKPLPCYPSVLETPSRSIVLVEGIFDMLNLYDKGMRNVVCVFGTSTLKSDTSAKLLPFKVQGITKIFILFDGDDAGRTAAAELKPLIEAEGFIVEIIPLEEGTDPGEMNQEDTTSVMEYTK